MRRKIFGSKNTKHRVAHEAAVASPTARASRRITSSRLSAIICVLAIGGIGTYLLVGSNAEAPTFITVGNPTYINANQLLPSPEASFYNQPWRGYMETIPATNLLNGIGVVYSPGTISDAQQDKDMQYMASIGVHGIRKEMPWGSIDPTNETQFTSTFAAKNATLFAECKKYGITPDLLLNANDGAPEPSFSPPLKGTLVKAAPAGSTQVTVTGVAASAIVVHKQNTTMGGSGMSDGDKAGVRAHYMFTNVVTNSDGSVTLSFSRPTLTAMSAGSPIHIQYFKYMPLYPVGTPEFNNTMAGWNKYITAVANAVKAAGLPQVKIEIWNEVTFGSHFLDANGYYATSAPVNTTGIDKMHQGGQAWELANQTTKYFKSVFGSSVKVDWGFSNTDAYKTAVPTLPSLDAESFHPYSSGLVDLGKTNKQSIKNLVPGPYVPSVQRQFAEGGFAALGNNVQNLITGKLQPSDRLYKQPPGITGFQYWFTEDGFTATNHKQVHTQAENDLLESKADLRLISFWLNKGVSYIDFNSAFGSDKQATRSGTQPGGNLLGYGALQDGGDPSSPTAEVLKNFTAQFAGATNLTSPRNLGVTVTDTTPNDNTAAFNVFPADPVTKEPALNYREMFQFLPFQVTNNKFVIPTYVSSMNIVAPPPAMDFQTDITNVNGNGANVSYYDPITNKSMPITVVSRSDHDIVVSIEAVDYPRLIEITESTTGGSGSSGGTASTASAPTVSLNTPTNGATVTGKIALTAAASANTKSVQFQLDGIKLGPVITNSPFTYNWDSSTVPNGTRGHVLSAVATSTAGISSTATASVLIVNPDLTPPSIPANLQVNKRDTTSITLEWNNSIDNVGGTGVAGYHLYRGGKLIASPLVSTTLNDFYPDTGLTANTTYAYTISAYDKAGNTSAISLPVSIATKPH
ncbi:MAG TPA: Ig-like domain-containing protein [Candidatus Saccharimonadales bacterium]